LSAKTSFDAVLNTGLKEQRNYSEIGLKQPRIASLKSEIFLKRG
jgi:hypothetical protein